jgi:cytochrome c peroxidase
MKILHLLLTALCVITSTAHAENKISATQSEVMNKLLATYADSAKVEFKEQNGRGAVSDKSFSAAIGRKFFLARRTWQSHDYTCSGCHTPDPRQEGRHIETKKSIKPLAPSRNTERFTNFEKVETNFKAHCMDLYERDCTAYEKGNFISYLMSVK